MDEPKNYSRAGRRQGRTRRGPSGPASATDPMQALWALVAVNVGVFVLWHVVPAPLVPALRAELLVSAGQVATHPWTLFTYAFSHIDAQHLLFNMYGLYVFGASLVMERGARELAAVYAASAVAGGLAHVVSASAPALGASAAVTALATIYALRYPYRRLLLMFVLPLPAWAAAMLFVGIDLVGLTRASDGIAHGAHLGGALAGLAWWYQVIRPEEGSPFRRR